MSASIEQLRAMTDEEVIAAHDLAAKHTHVGTDYWMDELHRREQVRLIQTNQRLSLASFVLTAVSTVTAIVAVVIALTS